MRSYAIPSSSFFLFKGKQMLYYSNFSYIYISHIYIYDFSEYERGSPPSTQAFFFHQIHNELEISEFDSYINFFSPKHNYTKLNIYLGK